MKGPQKSLTNNFEVRTMFYIVQLLEAKTKGLNSFNDVVVSLLPSATCLVVLQLTEGQRDTWVCELGIRCSLSLSPPSLSLSLSFSLSETLSFKLSLHLSLSLSVRHVSIISPSLSLSLSVRHVSLSLYL